MLKNRIIYLIILISTSTLVYFKPTFFTVVIFNAVILLSLVSIAHLIFSYASIKVLQKISPTVIEHDKNVEYELILYNESLLPFPNVNVSFIFNTTIFKDQLESLNCTIAPKEKKSFTYIMPCKYRGVYTIGIDFLKIIDILKVFSLTERKIESRNVTIHPKITPLPNFKLTPKAHGNLTSNVSNKFASANSLVDIREFVQGDSLKKIHWKLSARYNKLLIKNFEHSTKNHTLIFLDTSKGLYDFETNIVLEDKLMESLVSIVQQCILENHYVEFIYNNFGIKHQTYFSRNDFENFLDTASSLTFRNKMTINELLEQYIFHIGLNNNLYGKDIFILTCNRNKLDEESIINQLLISNCNLHIVECELENQLANFSAYDSINYYSLTPETKIESVFQL